MLHMTDIVLIAAMVKMNTCLCCLDVLNLLVVPALLFIANSNRRDVLILTAQHARHTGQQKTCSGCFGKALHLCSRRARFTRLRTDFLNQASELLRLKQAELGAHG